jgi:hypothetical protein
MKEIIMASKNDPDTWVGLRRDALLSLVGQPTRTVGGAVFGPMGGGQEWLSFVIDGRECSVHISNGRVEDVKKY